MPVIRSETFAAALLALVAAAVAVAVAVAVVVVAVAVVVVVVAPAVTPGPERPDPPFWAERTRVEKNMANVTTIYISAFFT